MIETVDPGQVVKASTTNQMITNVNTSPGRSFNTSSGSWDVPDGVHRIKVTICGGGGYGGATGTVGSGGDSVDIAGGNGGDSPMISCLFDVETGSTFNFTIGAGGSSGTPTGGTTTFGASLLISTGGGVGETGSGSWDNGISETGDHGDATFPSGEPHIFHGNDLFLHSTYEWDHKMRGYGVGGSGGPGYSGYGGPYERIHSVRSNGRPGMVLIEW